jgi:D-alanyl-D-alanine carboxypeptidase/D-alanyl-D-alanine-endopeptidase (penicillin-binding protein 4)
MRNVFFLFLLAINFCFSQNITEKLSVATQNFLKSPGMYSGNLSFFVSDENGNLLGKDYTYTTTASYQGEIKNNELVGNLIISSNGDPTLGSWRYPGYEPENFKKRLMEAVQNLNIKKLRGNIIIDDSYFDFQTIPGGWPWNDLGNYYGAGTFGVNWRENQFDIHINGNQFKSFSYDLNQVNWINELKTGGNSDQSLIFTAPHSETAMINGTLPAGKVTTVSGATPNPPIQLAVEIKKLLEENGISISGKTTTYYNEKIEGKSVSKAPTQNQIFEYKSPTLDKIVYWFLRKSINLYGETLIKTMAKEKRNNPTFETGVDFLKDFWKSKGINPMMINFADGSGLSPQNYVSAKAQVQALLYAKKQNWFDAFYEGFPTQNGIKMKSGTIKDSKSFAGYQTSKSGKNYVFSIILNNYQGGSISNALFKVLDNLK